MLLLLLAGCVNFPYFYDREFYLASLLRWEDNDHDGFREVDGDCDDAEATVNPDIEETCNDRDDNCDEEIDNNALDAQAWFQDNDADGFGNTDVAYVGCDDPTGFSLVDGDCDDTNANVHPEAEEPCGDAKDVDCDGLTGDHDGDGDGSPSCHDCLDTNAAVNRDAVEVCNGGIDDNCDDEADGADALGAVEWFLDADNDNHGAGEPIVQCLAPSNYATVNDDCDDTNPEIWPGTTEICDNGQDDNCDGETNGCRTEGLMIVEGRLTGSGGSVTGAALRGPGDTNGDGADDILVGIGATETHPNGAVFLVLGPVFGDVDAASSSTVTLSMPTIGTIGAGAPIEVLGDLGGDGLQDWAIGGVDLPGGGHHSGIVYVLPAQGGHARIDEVSTGRIWETIGDTYFAYDFSPMEDVNADGEPDLMVGALSDPTNAEYGGAVRVYTDLVGDVLDTDSHWSAYGEYGFSFGISAESLDCNGDGLPDAVVGAVGANGNSGAIYTYFGPLSGEHYIRDADATVVGDTGSLLGVAMAVAGDADRDGTVDLWVAANNSSVGADGGGAAYLFTDLTRGGSVSSASTAVVGAETAEDFLGDESRSIDSDDLDGDGFADLVIGAPGFDNGLDESAGKVYLFYGPFAAGLTMASSADAWHVGSTPRANAGAMVTIPGDLDGDGNLDIALQELGELDGANDRVNILYGYSW